MRRLTEHLNGTGVTSSCAPEGQSQFQHEWKVKQGLLPTGDICIRLAIVCRRLSVSLFRVDDAAMASSTCVTSGPIADIGGGASRRAFYHAYRLPKRKFRSSVCSARQVTRLSLSLMSHFQHFLQVRRQPGKQTLPANRSPTMVKKMDKTKRT